jgi:hypothetical protein
MSWDVFLLPITIAIALQHYPRDVIAIAFALPYRAPIAIFVTVERVTPCERLDH